MMLGGISLKLVTDFVGQPVSLQGSSMTLEDGTDRLSQNVSNHLPTYALYS